jgi:hypothetical protein
MYYYLIGALKRRLIMELQDSFSRHAVYRKIVPFIQNKFAFTERPQFGIVVKGSNANKIQLSADNFVGTIQSHVMLANVGPAVHPIEWVREDLAAVRERGMDTLPGVYYIEILTVPTTPGEVGTFAVDPLLTAYDQPLLKFQTGIEREAQLQHAPIEGTVRIWENHRFLLKEGVDYSVDYSNGAITLISAFSTDSVLTADYRYAAPSVGPVEFRWNTANPTTLPGVIMAFGKRAEVGQKVAVVVYEDRVDTAQAYGGKFEVSFDLDAIARDPDQMEEIGDLIIMYLWGEKRDKLSFEGLEITDTSMGGEAEEIYDETGDDYFYQASMSVQVQGDWEIHVPMPLVISRVTPRSSEYADSTSGLQAVPDDLFYATHPVLVGKSQDFERIT